MCELALDRVRHDPPSKQKIDFPLGPLGAIHFLARRTQRCVGDELHFLKSDLSRDEHSHVLYRYFMHELDPAR